MMVMRRRARFSFDTTLMQDSAMRKEGVGDMEIEANFRPLTHWFTSYPSQDFTSRRLRRKRSFFSLIKTILP